MDTDRPDEHAARAAGRRMLYDEALEALVVEGMSADEWVDHPATVGLARRLGLEDAPRHIAALVWSRWAAE